MASTTQHEMLQEESTTGSSEEDGRITAYESDASEADDQVNNNDDAGNHVEMVDTVGAITSAVVDAVTSGGTQDEDEDEDYDEDGNNIEDEQNGNFETDTLDDNNNNGIAGQENDTTTYGGNGNGDGTAQFHGAMYRINQLLNMTTTSFLMYFTLTLNGIIFFIGSLSNTRNLGRLWFRADYTKEYEYSFGWYKSSELEGDWTPVGYEDLDGYFDTNIVGAGDFFGVVCIFGVVLLILLGIISMCMGVRETSTDMNIENANENDNDNDNNRSGIRKKIRTLDELVKRNRTSKICSGVLLGLSSIFGLIYIVSILTFHTEFEDVCGELIGLLDSAHKYYHSEDLDHYECDDGWALYLQYANILIYILSMVLYYELQKGKIAIQIAQQIKYLDS